MSESNKEQIFGELTVYADYIVTAKILIVTASSRRGKLI